MAGFFNRNNSAGLTLERNSCHSKPSGKVVQISRLVQWSVIDISTLFSLALEEVWGKSACLDVSVCNCLRLGSHALLFLSILMVFVGVGSTHLRTHNSPPHLCCEGAMSKTSPAHATVNSCLRCDSLAHRGLLLQWNCTFLL